MQYLCLQAVAAVAAASCASASAFWPSWLPVLQLLAALHLLAACLMPSMLLESPAEEESAAKGCFVLPIVAGVHASHNVCGRDDYTYIIKINVNNDKISGNYADRVLGDALCCAIACRLCMT